MPIPHRRGVLLLLFAAALLLIVLGSARPALAHTELVHREFVGGTADKPQQLLLRFSEPIDAQFLTVSVFDTKTGQQSAGSVRVDPQRKIDGLVDISGLAPGNYSVAWWTRALDGDPSNGSFLIGIGTAVDPVALLPPVGARDPATQPAMFYGDTAWDTLLHWFIYIGAALMVGSLGFVLVTWRPTVRKVLSRRRSGGAEGGPDAGLSRAERESNLRLLRMYHWLAAAGAMLFLFANLMLFVMQVELIRYAILQPITSSTPTPLAPSALSHEAPYRSAADIFRGYNGQVWIARVVLAVLTLALVLRLSSSGGRSVRDEAATGRWATFRRAVGGRRWEITLASALATLATVSLTGHAAVVAQARYAVVVDWSHMTVMSLWIGGLVPLILTMREGRRLAGSASAEGEVGSDLFPSVVRRFSSTALLAVMYLAATGLFAAYLHVRHASILIPTTYGRTFIAKLVLFAGLVGFGALHRRVSIPRLERASGARRTTLERMLPAEAGVGFALLAAVALMASLGTSAAVWPGHQALGLVSSSQTGALTATFRAVPGKTGENAIALDLADRRPGEATTIQKVTIEIDGRTLALTPASDLVLGSVQRFVSNALVDLQEGKKTLTYTVARPTYPEVSGGITVVLPAALSSGG
jgi:copper transport protein